VDSERLFWSVLLIAGLAWMLLWAFFMTPTMMKHAPVSDSAWERGVQLKRGQGTDHRS